MTFTHSVLLFVRAIRVISQETYKKEGIFDKIFFLMHERMKLYFLHFLSMTEELLKETTFRCGAFIVIERYMKKCNSACACDASFF